MAEIFLARERGIEGVERQLVVKRILEEMTTVDDFVTMFADEARLATRLTHPNIAHVYNFGEIDGIYYLTMEYVEGLTVTQLVRRLKGRRIPAEICLRVVGDVCAGLHYAHDLRDDQGELLGVVHRDISPQNVMVSSSGMAKIIDFGVARTSTQMHVTGLSQIKGKLAYMAPEMLKPTAKRQVDRRCDIFAAGVLLFEMITGRRLFRRDSEAATITAVREHAPPSVTAFDVPGAVDSVVAQAVAKDPAERYQTAQEMQDDIEELIATSAKTATPYVVSKFMRKVLDGALDDVETSFSFSSSSSAPMLNDPSSRPAMPMLTDPSSRPSAPPAPESLTPSLPELPSFDELEVDLEELNDDGNAEGIGLPPPPDAAVVGFAPLAPPIDGDTASGQTEQPSPPTFPSITPGPISNIPSAPGRRRLWIAGLIAAGTLALLVFSGVLLLFGGHGDDGAGEELTASMVTPVGDAAAPPTPVPADGLGGGSVTKAPVDAGPPQAKTSSADADPPSAKTSSSVDAGTKVEASPSQAQAPPPPPGSLFLDSDPWSKVRAGRRSLGTTPILGSKLAAGVHFLRLTDPDGVTHRRRVVIRPGQNTKVFYRLQ